MNIILLSEEHKEYWNTFVNETLTGHVLQTWEYGDVRIQGGTQVDRIGIFDKDTLIGGAQLSLHSIPKLPFKIGYIARGPVLQEHTSKLLSEFLHFLKTYASQNNVAFIKLEPNVRLDSPEVSLWKEQFRSFGIKHSSNPRFMNATSIIDLSQPEDTLLAHCRKNTRYYIRKAEREHIVFEEAQTKDDVSLFYSLLSETASRQNFSLTARPLSYFENMWDQFHQDTLSRDKALRIFFAKINDTPVATTMNIYSSSTAYYPYGASSTTAHGTSATEGLMWHSISQAKAAGCSKYDLWGVLANENKNHPYWGYTFFKNGFGGNTIEYFGSYDFPTKPLLYKPLIAMEKLRRILLRLKIL